MPLYSHRCRIHGAFDHIRTMADSATDAQCPVCRAFSPRVFTAPYLNLGDATARRLLDATMATADAPPVVNSLPGSSAPRRRQRVTTNPLHRKLPKQD